jgi:hypothetical protein
LEYGGGKHLLELDDCGGDAEEQDERETGEETVVAEDKVG